MRILIAAGGTGGHVYPALAVSEAMQSYRPDVKLVFVGSPGGMERALVEESGIPFESYHEVRSGPLNGVSIGRRLVSVVQIVIGLVQALALMLRLKPSALMLTGGWVGIPVALVARLLRVPSLIYLPDVEPGLSIQVLQRFANLVAITVPDSAQYFPPGKTVVTGYPLRRQMTGATREAAQAYFKLDPTRKTLLLFGGSRGAQSLNNALAAILPELLEDGVQIIHVSGTLDWSNVEARMKTLSDATGYHAYPYLHQEMGLAMAAADLVVSRAGASTLGEFPLFGLPAILVPYPHAWRYQKVNADTLAQRGAAVVMKDEDMSHDLLATIRALLNDPARLAEMREHSKRLAQPDSAWQVGQALLRLAGDTP